jgi:hypothetical protein
MKVLTCEQMRQYEDEGYVLVSGLIDPGIASAAAAALWRGLGADSNDKATWVNVPRGSGHNAPEIVACFTPLICAAAAELANEGLPRLRAPSSTYSLNIFPQEGSWRPHGPHIDHALEKDGYKVFPRPMRVASIIYLNDVPENGAPTVVWPGSYKKIEALAKSDPVHYELMMTLNEELDKLDLGEPVQVSSKLGDILFYHYLTAHSGSTNATDIPRLALVHKWCHVYCPSFISTAGWN